MDQIVQTLASLIVLLSISACVSSIPTTNDLPPPIIEVEMEP